MIPSNFNRLAIRATLFLAKLSIAAFCHSAFSYETWQEGVTPPPESPSFSLYVGSPNLCHWDTDDCFKDGQGWKGSDHTFTMNNLYQPDFVKHFWLQIVTNEQWTPRPDGLEPFVTAQTVLPSFATVVTKGLKYKWDGKTTTITMTWDLTPQPSKETVSLGVLELQWTKFRSIQGASFCTPVPEPEVISMVLAGLAVFGASAFRGRRAQERIRVFVAQ
jgi:hypothetical protein